MKHFSQSFKLFSRNIYLKFPRSTYNYTPFYEIIKSSEFSNEEKKKSYFNISLNLTFAGIAGKIKINSIQIIE